nr:hypothetical protein [Rhodococcus sp. KRD162]
MVLEKHPGAGQLDECPRNGHHYRAVTIEARDVQPSERKAFTDPGTGADHHVDDRCQIVGAFRAEPLAAVAQVSVLPCGNSSA